MSLPVFVGVLTFAPAVFALLIAATGLARRALAPLALGLAVIGALVPAICLLIIAPWLASGVPLFFTLLGGGVGQNDWLSAAYRVDSFGLYAALGIVFIITPLLLWMAWQRGGVLLAAETTGDTPAADTGVADDVDDPTVVTVEAVPATSAAPVIPFTQRMLARPIWLGLALALGVESAALTVVFADNILWLALAWLALAALAWGLGEAGSDPDTLDRPGLLFMLAGPILWVIVFLLPAIKATGLRIIYPRFTEMMGRGGVPPLQIVALGIAITLAGGAYPFVTWVRRRAALVAPAGLAAVALVALPLAIFVGARTYSAAQDVANSWQQIGQARPPITGGIFIALLGAITVGICGLLALDRRDGRALVAYLAAAQVGWGLLALGVGSPVTMVGIVLLLTTAVLGLGAMLAALYAGGALTGDVEPDAAGPRPLGAPLRRVHVAAWTIGALAVVGAPLCAGFVARQAISAGAIQARGLLIPLTGLTWAGDALLALALLRATAPAFANALDAATGAAPAELALTEDEAAVSDETVSEEPSEGEEAVQAVEPKVAPRAGLPLADVLRALHEAPAPILAVLLVIVAVAPQVLIGAGGIRLAAGALVQAGTIDAAAPATTLGYTVGPAQLLATLAWLAILVLAVLRIFIVPVGGREARPLYLAGQKPVARAAEEAEEAAEMQDLPAPREAWHELGPAFTSPWVLPGAEWLLKGTDDEEETLIVAPAEEGSEAEDVGAEEEPEEAADLDAAEWEHLDEVDEVEAVETEATANTAGAAAEEAPIVVAPPAETAEVSASAASTEAVSAREEPAVVAPAEETPVAEEPTVAAPTEETSIEETSIEAAPTAEAHATEPAAAVEDEAPAVADESAAPAEAVASEASAAPLEEMALAERAAVAGEAAPGEEPMETQPVAPAERKETANGAKPAKQPSQRTQRPAPVTATPRKNRGSRGASGKSGRNRGGKS
ncbi:MAG TPA: proton-conducting transporter membrane subunit [Ktedonobacterales bacterium]|nr:proton-conducting transporter membrane subunit [Ktedonobacterales bacterium]